MTIRDLDREVEVYLIEKGFKCYGKGKDGEFTLYQKQVSKTQKHFINVKRFEFEKKGVQFKSYQVEIRFETKGNHWADVNYYSLGANDILNQLDDFAERLINCILTLNGNEKDYIWESGYEN